MHDIRELSIQDTPKSLLEITDPPKKLYIRGTLPSHYEYVYLTVIGSRKHTEYGKSACERIISELRGYPIVIVSGLALGMDAIAHRAALANDISTIAIPGSGLADDALYPATNTSLAREILDRGGCLLSEYEPHFRATQWSFPRRNRLMAGISRAVLVIEAGKKSGSLITASLATDYNRDICAVPGSIFSEMSLGTNALIRDGAYPITSGADIINILGLDVDEGMQREETLFSLSGEEKELLDTINDYIGKDELIRTLGKKAHEIHIILSTLEMMGLVKIEGNKIRKII